MAVFKKYKNSDLFPSLWKLHDLTDAKLDQV